MKIGNQLSYWGDELLEGIPILQLPYDYSKSQVKSYTENVQAFTLTRSCLKQIESVCMKEEATFFMVLLAAYQSFLYRYTGQNDIVVGCVIEDGTAVFPNRINIYKDMHFKQILAQVKENLIVSQANQNVSLNEIFEKNEGGEPDNSHLYQTILNYKHQGQPSLSKKANKIFLETVDISLFISEVENGLHISFNYNTNLFEDITIKRMTENFSNWIEQVTSHNDISIDLLRLTSAAQENQLLKEWSGLKSEISFTETILSAFQDQVNLNSNEVAIIFEDEQLTYKELDMRSNQLANYLRKKGVNNELLVGICLERSLDMMISLLGVLKAGGAYVPMDPAYPAQRLQYIMNDAKLQIIITCKKFICSVPEGIEVVCVDCELNKVGVESIETPISNIKGDNLAYVMYTSGSTGNPKGVMIEHHSIMNFLYTLEHRYTLTKSDKLLQKTSISFDASVWELFWWMLKGTRLYILPTGDEKDPALLVKAIAKNEITHLEFVPSMLKIVLEYIEKEGYFELLSSLKYVTVGGEVLPLQVVQKFNDLLTAPHGTVLYNTYGPTETTVEVTSFNCVSSGLRGQIPIGKANFNTKLYIMNEQLQLQPTGVVGELYIGGMGVARGYLYRSKLTDERFIPNPHSCESGSRLYRTGDLVKCLPDGNLEYIGRSDNQVKIRGYRIELGEIEAALNNHDKINQSIVLVKNDNQGNKKLVAYIIGDGSSLTWREYLKKQLPDYMIPAYFFTLDVFPLTPSGKIDIKSLPEEGHTRPHISTEFIKPESNMEVAVADIWRDLLGYDEIGIKDDFFELGGHSLLATQVIARIRESFKKELPLSSVFHYPTIHSLIPIINETEDIHIMESPLNIKQAPRDIKLPLSYSQERVWFLEQLSSNNLAYIFQATMNINGKLNIRVLERSFTEIVRRHEIFRTAFLDDNGKPYQFIYEPFNVQLPVVDLSMLTSDERVQEANNLIQKEIVKPINISMLPLVRWIVYQLSENHYILLFIEHHLVHDGWSFRKFLKELFTIYSAYLKGQPSPLAELPIQFADYCVWQNEMYRRGKTTDQLLYWKDKLNGTRGILDLPTDRPRPVSQSFNGSSIIRLIPEELYIKLRTFCMNEKTTLYMVMMAAFQTLLHRYSTQKDIIVGSGIANRKWKETEDLIGMFVNNVVIRTEFSEDISFEDILQQVKKSALEAYENQDIPFDQVVDSLGLERDKSRNPLFQVMFSFHDTKINNLPVEDLEIQLIEGISNGSAKFDINVVIINHSELSSSILSGEEYGSISIDWEYNSDVYEDHTMRRMIEHYIELLNSILENSKRNVHTLPMLSHIEEDQLLNEWNNTNVFFEHNKTIHQIFDEQTEKTPDKIAVVFENKHWTYREINNCANSLAYALRGLGVKADQIVGLISERSAEMMIGILAILKAGGAYLPIDTEAPKERINYILEDSGAKVVVSQKKFSALFDFDGTIVDLDGKLYSSDNIGNIGAVSNSRNLAYVIYTSGSTGKPKGVMIEHSSVVNRIEWMRKQYSLDENDVILQKTSYSFDVSVGELLLWFFVGGRICFLKQGAEKDPELIMKTIIEQNVTQVHFVPSMLNIFLDYIEMYNYGNEMENLDRVFTSGETLALKTVERFNKLMGQSGKITLHNMYGPTETTIEVTYYDCNEFNGVIPIGKPISNNKAYILNTQLNLQPIGVIGELFIAGVGLARGYLNRPELTSDNFISNPFSKNVGERLYKTGDLARWLPSGNIEYIGRIDNQVKIRGYRIELGEIEAVLGKHPHISEVAVIALEYGEDDKRLIAYIVSDGELDDCKNYTKERLPHYMIPSYFVKMKALPLTVNGKLDRKALPHPDILAISKQYIAPRTSTEDLLVSAWREILKVERIGVNDSFFDLGGHSLLATQLISRLREVFDLYIPLRVLFEYPTIEDMAIQLLEIRKNMELLDFQILNQEDKKRGITLSFGQQRLWFLDQLEPNSSAYNIPYVWHLSGAWKVEGLEKGFNALIQRHEMLRTIFPKQTGEPIQIVESYIPKILPVIDLSDSTDEEKDAEINKYIDQEAMTVFDLSQGPLIQAKLIMKEKRDYFLLCTMHHIVSDGWSEDILLDEWLAFYEEEVRGKPASLAPLPIQYGDFAVWQRKSLTNKVIAEQLEYWKSELSGELPVLQLPIDRPRPVIQSYVGDMQHVILPSYLFERLKIFSRHEGATLFMTLLSAYQGFLYRYTGQEEILVGTPVANRNIKEIEGLIGFFVNTLVFRADLKDSLTFTELLAQTKEKALRGQENQDVPFEKIVETLQPDRNTSYSPVFQTMFTMQNHLRSIREISDHKIEIVKSQMKVAKYDLTISFEVTTDDFLNLSFGYNTDLFNSWTIERMIGHFINWLEQLMEYPHESIANLRLISKEEEKQLLEVWSNNN